MNEKEDHSTNVVVGATGTLGTEICRLLADEGEPARALVRRTSDQARVERLQGLATEIVEGDLKHYSSLVAACHGASTVISTASSTLSRQVGDSIQSVDLQGQLNLIDAANAAKVKQFVLISFPEMDTEFPLQTAKRDVEKHLKESGLNYTILRPSFFMEVWLSPALGFDASNATAQIYGSGRNKISWISIKDVAQFAVASLNNPAAQNAVIELGGPDALSPLEVVTLFEKQTGRPFAVQHVSDEQLRAQKEGATDSLQESFAGLMLSYAQGGVIDMDNTLQKFPIKLSSVQDYARQIV